MDSIWTKTAQMPHFDALKTDLKTDVLIIGGGMAGLLCAWQLAQAGVDYALVEARSICSGATRNTTAKISAQHGLIYHRLLRMFDTERAQLYLQANLKAVEAYAALCRNIDCGFVRQDSCVYALGDRRQLARELDALRRLGADASLSPALPLPFAAKGGVRMPAQAQFHPLKFAAVIANGLRIYEHTKVRQLLPGKALTSGGTIRAEKIIIATHFPMLNKHGRYFLKLYQHRSYVLALRGAPRVDGMYVDASKNGLSFRQAGDVLLLGGGGGRTGRKCGGWNELEAFAQKHYPQASVAARWAAQDCMSLDGVPYIGQYARHTPRLYVATGFSKWGVSSSMAAAMILCDLVQEKQNPYAQVFSPARSSLRPQLFINAAESAASLLSPTAPRCPHMGCALKYNRAEHSWDCPCHGSRFEEDGTLIDNPATDDKRM